MPKKILALIMALIFLGIFFFWQEKDSQETLQATDREQEKQTDTTLKSEESDSQSLNTNQLKYLKDETKEPVERVRLISEVELKEDNPEQLLKIRELVSFIVSENPFNSNSESIDPHSFKVHQHQQEASLRVHALKTLSENLTIEKFRIVVQSIEKKSKDEAIIRIANQALEAKKNNQNYFENLRRGIHAMPLPEAHD